MPKKPPRNAFYFYMIDFKEEQRKKGIHYGNMNEVSIAASPSWKDAPPSIRTKYEARAKREKQKYNIADMKYTSTGISIAEIEQQQQELKLAEESELKDIRNIVKLKSFDKTILEENFYLMDVNAYCQVAEDYIIGESTLLRFNMRDGIKDHYHEFINPGYIPTGYASDMKISCKELCLEMPFEAPEDVNYKQRILAHIIDYMTQEGKIKILPPIFTMPDKVAPVQNFIQQLCFKAGQDPALFRVYKLHTLFFNLVNSLTTTKEEGFPKESLALAQLQRDPFKYTPELGCEHHETADMSIQCTTSRTKRWAFTVLDNSCPLVGIALQPGQHMPSELDVDLVLNFREQNRQRVPTVETAKEDSVVSHNCSLNESSFSSSSTRNASALEPKKEKKRIHQPLRMPKTDYSQTISLAPELTERNFPSLGTGHGRGRGSGSLTASLERMGINK